MCSSGTLARSAMLPLAVLAVSYIAMHRNPISFLRISFFIFVNHGKT
jgi:hypothetical protein